MSISAIERYYRQTQTALSEMERQGGKWPWFSPGSQLPTLTPEIRQYLRPAQLSFAEMGSVDGRRLILLDLMRNPRTKTTKTFASLIIVARAIDYMQRTGERIMILTPSSANKATALRDAVARAYESGVASPNQLRITCVVPQSSLGKLWDSPLNNDPELRSRNPMCLYSGESAVGVKTITRDVVENLTEQLWSKMRIKLWFTLDLANYRPADAVRAFAEQDLLPPQDHISRWHAHAVSSAFGLLGHWLGTTLLPSPRPAPGYFLVQHLATPDMVLSLYKGDTARSGLPPYEFDEKSFLYRQDIDRHFPATTFDVGENLEGTFYTKAPDTSAELNEIIRRQGGGGIVVSLHECLENYPRVRALLTDARVILPADPRDLREWSLVMAVTGVLKGIDRGLVTADEVVIHGSGSYAAADYTPLPRHHAYDIADGEELRQVVLAAVR